MLDFSDLSKLQTRSGNRVRIYCTDGVGEYPIHGAVYSNSTNGWHQCSWRADGTSGGDCWSLVSVPPAPTSRVVWMNIYREEKSGQLLRLGVDYAFRNTADAAADRDSARPGRVGCNRVTLRAEFDDEPISGVDLWFMSIPSGQTPICFVTTGEMRCPKAGEWYLSVHGEPCYSHETWTDEIIENKRRIIVPYTATKQ